MTKSHEDQRMSSDKAISKPTKSLMNGNHRFENMAKSAGEKADSMVTDIGKVAAFTLNSGRTYIKEHPVEGVAFAAAAGLVAGSILTMFARGGRE